MAKITRRGGASVQRFDPPRRPTGDGVRRKTAKVEAFGTSPGEQAPTQPDPEPAAKPRKRARKRAPRTQTSPDTQE